MYPFIHEIQVSTYPSIQKKSVSKISKHPDIRKKWYPSIPSLGDPGSFLVTSILGMVRNVEIAGATQQLVSGNSHDFLAIFALAHSKINQIA